MKKGLWIIVILLIHNGVIAQSEDGDAIKVPTLNGHRFIGSRLVDDPFIKSSFRVNMGIGRSSLSYPPILIGDSLVDRASGSLLFANLSMRFDLKLQDWVSFSYRASGAARVGSDPQTLFTNGLNTIVGNNIGWKIRLFQNRGHSLSMSAGLLTYDVNITNVAKFINDIINGSQSPNLTERINALQGSFGIHYAHGFNSVIGFALDGNYTFGDLFESGQTGGYGRAGISIDINTFPKTNVPLGFVIGYAYARMPDYTVGQFNNTSIYNFKIAYTQSPDFIISVDGTGYEAPYLTGDTNGIQNRETTVINYSINMLIYFN